VASNEADFNLRIRGSYAAANYSYGLGGALYSTADAMSVSYTPISWSNVTGGAYNYAGYDLVAAPRTRVAIDPNVRVRGNGTYVGFEDITGAIALNEPVEVYEPESGLTGQGCVIDIDAENELVYLSVDWSSLAEAVSQQPPSASQGHILYISAGQTDGGYDWLGLSEAPSLAFVTLSGTAFQVTAPARGWWAETSLSGTAHHLGILQPYAGLTTDLVVVV
jgi:hypothetical protein